MTIEERRAAVTVDLVRSGIEVMRGNLQRKFPNATEAEIVHRLGIWLRERPSAPDGDADGVPSSRFN